MDDPILENCFRALAMIVTIVAGAGALYIIVSIMNAIGVMLK